MLGSSYKRLVDEPDDLEDQIVGERLRNSPRYTKSSFPWPSFLTICILKCPTDCYKDLPLSIPHHRADTDEGSEVRGLIESSPLF